MTDVVYFLAHQAAFYQHRELLYSLRSLEKHVAGVDQVFVVGAPPAWGSSGLALVPECDPYDHNKDANIIRKMLLTCRHSEISEPFLFVNDDHYFSQDCRSVEFPFYHKGEIRAAGTNREYNRRLANTRLILEERGLPTLNYDIHTPILIYREDLQEVFAGRDWVDLDGPGVVMKSLYANSRPEIAGVYLPDCKLGVRVRDGLDFWEEKLQTRPCWSTGEYIPRLVWEVLERLYPEPSFFEEVNR